MPKYSDEAKRLWPFLLPYVEKVRSTTIIQQGGSGGGGSGGAPTDAVLRDGSRSLLGNWSVEAGITIDGVDISAHAADPDAHHERAVAGEGIVVDIVPQEISVNTAFNFAGASSWTGTHQFDVDPQINANLDFTGAIDRYITAGSHLHITPDDDLVLTPGGVVSISDMDTPIRTALFADSMLTGITGFNNYHLAGNVRQLAIGAIKTDNLYARFFTADEIRVERGSWILSRSYGIVETDFVVPADEATVDVWFEEAPELEDAKLFVAGNWLVARIIDLDGPQILTMIFFQVVDADGAGSNDYIQREDATDDHLSRQQWTLRRKFGGTTGQTIKKGVTIVDLGVVGQGAISMTALAQNDGPYIQTEIFDSVVDDRPQYEAKTRMGNLKNTVDYITDTFGFATGDNLGLLPSAGFSGMASESTNGLRLFNVDIELYEAGNLASVLHRTHGLAFLNDTALFDSELRTVSWYDDLDDIGSAFATARMSAWGGSSDRRTQITSFGLEASSIHLTASGDGGVNVAGLSVKAGWDTHTTQVDMVARDTRIIGGGAMLLVGGDTSKYADSAIHAYENSTGTGSSAGITVEQDGSGDALLHWSLSLGQAFTAGIDNSDGDKWKVSAGMSLGTTDYITIDAAAGTVTIVGLTGGSVSTGLIGGDGIDLAGETISVDSTVVRTTRNVSSGDGLQGGGNLSADRTLAVDSTVVRTTRDLTAGDGLTGGGNLSSNRTFAVGAGDGISVAADSVAVNSTVARNTWAVNAGTGLTGGGNLSAGGITINVGSGDGMTASADAIAVNLGANSGLTFSSGTLVMGTPTNLNASSASAISTTTHSHAIETSSDVSAGVRSILASTVAGGLGLASLFTTGAVTVGQGLTAANTAFRVIHHTHDYDHVHVVVNPTGGWSLDEQFGVDIDDNLLVRGWIVGKHAIQLDGATMLLHYDGPERIGNLSGQTRGHLGQVPVSEASVTFAPGKFGKAVQVGSAGINYVTNPSFEVDATNWTSYSTGTATGTRTIVAEEAYAGTYSYKFVKTGGTPDSRLGAFTSVTLFTPTTYTISAYVKIPAAAGSLQRFHMEVNGGITGIATWLGPTDGWVRLSVTGAWTTGTVFVYLYIDDATTMTAYIDAVQVEGGSGATAYMDGTLGNGHAWTGAAHGSTTGRSEGVLTYNTAGVLNQRAGSFMAWVHPTSAAVDQMVFSHFATGDQVFLRATSAGAWDYEFSSTGGTTTGTVTANAWQHIAMTWEGAVVNVYLNGNVIATNTLATWDALGDIFAVGHYVIGPAQHWRGLIDDVVILNRASPPDEVRAVYESNAPVFAETSTWHWRTGRNRIYADAEGLWGLGASGGTVLGLYAGDEENPAATKSWGGLSLSEGDFLLGQYGSAKGGWMHFDQDLVGGLPAWRFGWGTTEVLRLDSGGASLNGVLDIDTSGGIYQGTGTFASPTTGLKVYNSGGIGLITGYNSGVAQWGAGTDGKLYAGANNVVLDANGVTIVAPNVNSMDLIPSTSSVSWKNGSTTVAFVAGGYDSSPDETMMRIRTINETIGALASLELSSTVRIGSGLYKSASIELQDGEFISMIGATTLTGTLTVSGAVTMPGALVNGQVAATLNDASLAPLYLANSSGPYVYLNSGISGSALGAYVGKMPISVGGTIRYIAIYA